MTYEETRRCIIYSFFKTKTHTKQVLLPACCSHPNPRTNLSAAGRTQPKEEISFKSGVLVTSGKTSCLITIDLFFFVAFSIGSLEWLAKIDHDGVSLPIVLWKHPTQTQTDGGC
jgi:hypothetical protein